MTGKSRTLVGRALAAWSALVMLPALAAADPNPDLSPDTSWDLSADKAAAVVAPICEREIQASVVALDQVYYWNRLGALEPQGMVYALERDVVHNTQDQNNCAAPKVPLAAGQVQLRRTKRPRPIVLRMNVGDCLTINFRNLLNPVPVDSEQPATRNASIHVQGLEYVNGIGASGLNVGTSLGGIIAPGTTTTYRYYAREEGTYLMYNGGAMVGGEGDGGSISAGLFGAVNVQPRGAEWYRSQVTQKDLAIAKTGSAGGFPILNYDAVYPTVANEHCQPVGTPVLKMARSIPGGLELVHSDLTAIITGPSRGQLAGASYAGTPTFIYPDRLDPFREFTIIFHDEIGAVQAFPHFQDSVLSHTLQSARDAFAINYGTGGAGAEVLANRIGVGPMHDCVECKYEEFFLTSWAIGDPAQVVDIPANAPCTTAQLRAGANCAPTLGPKATRVYYADDPSNVYHSYLNDNVKFRNLHAGSDDHHIFHLHAHQWLKSPNSDKSAYHDSMAIGQGSSFTYEIAYGGSGNRNKTVGDSIFHCHFYPHFAQGMWSLWRVHDVLEVGTKLGVDGRPKWDLDGSGNIIVANDGRALPDGEIRYGTPIPAIVPIPGQAMPPLPATVQLVNGQIGAIGAGNPGYPFFVPARAGHRPPEPPLDVIDNGGLKRHIIVDGTAAEEHTRYSMDKELLSAQAVMIPDVGTAVEQTAMAFHAAGTHATRLPNGTAATFKVNTRQPVRGAPFADPCDPADPISPAILPPRVYKAANIQMDMVFNKAGWHFPQQRLITLWEDVMPTLLAQRPPEPFFFRANSRECIEYHHTNLMPSTYMLDDFEVRTPTDIVSQHIHLVKFDVLASDGGGNGFNYEDGTMAAEEVQERIKAIRTWNSCLGSITGGDPRDGQDVCPVVEVHPFFAPIGIDADCDGHDDWLGARTTVQRWWADPVLDNTGRDRTLRTIFTHDHFGPSTHQQVGLYSGLVIEKAGSTWFHNETNQVLGSGRSDGGPTSWQARIEGPESFREFLLEFGDFQHAYKPNAYGPRPAGQLQLSCPGKLGFADPANAINPPAREEAPLPTLYQKIAQCPVNDCDPDGPIEPNLLGLAAPCPEAFSAKDPGTGVVNYRNEPLALRVRDPNTNQQATWLGEAGDLSFAYETRTDRADPLLNGASSPLVPYPPLTGGVQPGDPFTPLMQVYEGDPVKIRMLVGAHEEEHTVNVHGVNWLYEPDDTNSGYKNGQMMGISEWMDFEITRMPSLGVGQFADFLYKPSNSNDFQWNGVWGLLRLARGSRNAIPPITANSDMKGLTDAQDEYLFRDVSLTRPEATDTTAGAGKADALAATFTSRALCPVGAPIRTYDIVALAASQAMASGTMIYNGRFDSVTHYDHAGGNECNDSSFVAAGSFQGPLHDPTAIFFARRSDVDPITGQLLPTVNPEPLILRALPGECVQVNLTNWIKARGYSDMDGYASVPMIVDGFNQNDVDPSMSVSLHANLLAYDILHSDGTNVGLNRATTAGYTQTVAPSQSITYHWYTGRLTRAGTWEPIEHGIVPLTSSDPIKHSNKGAVGALIVEPANSTWLDSTPIFSYTYGGTLNTRAQTVVTIGSGTDRIQQFHEAVAIFQDDINLRFRNGEPVPNLTISDDPTETGQDGFNYRTEPIWFRAGWTPNTPLGYTRTFTSFDQVMLDSFVGGRPQTPIFDVKASLEARMRMTHPAGDTQNQVFEVTGHNWETEACTANSTVLGWNPLSPWTGSTPMVGPGTKADLLLWQPGGAFAAGGEHLYRSYVAWGFDGGLWGLFRVNP